MSEHTIESMKAELESNGYGVPSRDLVYKGDVTYDTVHNGDGLCAVEQAYAYLQRERELAALRKYVMEIRSESENIKKFTGKWSDPIESAFANLLMVAYRSWAYIELFNITEPDDISDATQDRLADLYPDDESDTE
jgi:hypothetical protein